ncbi:hypothetical protein B566_EDAN016259, partial [Ephemera danica]
SVCSPNPCPTNAICTPGYNSTGKARPVCECTKDYRFVDGQCVPPECTADTDCSKMEACLDYHCVSLCVGNICGENAKCTVAKHRETCSCLAASVCSPNPCPTNAICTPGYNSTGKARPVCECTKDYRFVDGQCVPPECTADTDCSKMEACLDYHCVSLCVGNICGENAKCTVAKHRETCSCLAGYFGNPFLLWFEHCKEGYIGDPFMSCQPECKNDADCSATKACQFPQCIDPCQDHCGVNANCEVQNHEAQCNCPESMTGDPKVFCRRI